MQQADDRFLRFREVHDITGLSRSTIWRLVKAGRFPASRVIGRTATAWLASEIRAWVNERAGSAARGR